MPRTICLELFLYYNAKVHFAGEYYSFKGQHASCVAIGSIDFQLGIKNRYCVGGVAERSIVNTKEYETQM
jgi:hypothetical protein